MAVELPSNRITFDLKNAWSEDDLKREIATKIAEYILKNVVVAMEKLLAKQKKAEQKNVDC